MKEQKLKNIRLLVENEEDLYTPFSPDADFNEAVKSYIRNKAIGTDYEHRLKLTVISAYPLDEEKFRSATANWASEEKAKFQQDDKHSTILYRAMFIIGAAIIILFTLLKQYMEPLVFTLLVILGTAVLGRGVSNWYIVVPAAKARKRLTEDLVKTSTIEFEYGEPSSTNRQERC